MIQEEKNHQIWAVVGVAIIKNGKVLLLRRANTSYMEGWLGFPGGHNLPEESPRQAAVREVLEETGLTITPERLEFLCVYARLSTVSTEPETVAYEFVLHLNDSETPKNAEPHRCSEMVWCDPKELPADIIDEFRQVVERSLYGGQEYLEIGY
jgi:8-oxo-dGTP diphosphatase